MVNRIRQLAPRRLSLAFGLTILAGLLLLTLSGSAQASREPSTASASAQSASQVLERKLWSPALGRQMNYAVYLPPGYDSSKSARYPVLYMLHGLGGDYLSWEKDGLFNAATDMIQRGEIGPMIIVTPEGEQGYWIDQANGGPRFGSYVTRDLVPAIDKEYRTMPNRLMRAIGGMSMGGHGALQLALNNPDEFGIVGAHSVALRRQDQAFAYFGDKQYFEAHDPVSLCAKNPVQAKKFTIWIDIGAKDGWYQQAEAFHRQLDGTSVVHQWHVFSGEHDDSYWSSHVADYLHYYSRSFGQATTFSMQTTES